MDVKLIALSPSGKRKVLTLTSEITTLGRQKDCHLRVPLGEISRQHCQFILNSNKLSVKDLGSSNGTFVNDQKVIQQELHGGDVVSLANALTLMVQIDGQPAKIDESRLRRAKPIRKAPAEEPASFEPAQPFATTSAGATADDEANQILSESFFLDSEEDEEEPGAR